MIRKEFCEQCGNVLAVRSFVIDADGATTVALQCRVCYMLDLLDDYDRLGRLDTTLLHSLLSDTQFGTTAPQTEFWHNVLNQRPHFDYTRVLQDYLSLNRIVAEFEKAVWVEGGVQHYISQSTHPGHSAYIADIAAYMFISDQSVIITLSLPDNCHVTVKVKKNDHTHSMHLSNISANLSEALWMLQQIMNAAELGILRFKPDNLRLQS